MTEPTRIAFALGGLAGNNAHGAGFLQAALEESIEPDMISCTSGQLLWVWHYLKQHENRTKELDKVFADELQKLTPLELIKGRLGEMLGHGSGVSGAGALPDLFAAMVRMSAAWPFGRDFAWWWLVLLGKTSRYKPALHLYMLDLARNLQFTYASVAHDLLAGRMAGMFLWRELSGIWPQRLVVPDFSTSFFEAVSAQFNASKIGIVFNSYEPQTGLERLYINEAARATLGRQYGDSGSYRQRSRYEPITPEAVKAGLWLYMYGFEDGQSTLDGAYYRDVILSELCAQGINTIYVARPVNHRWLGALPTNYIEGKDLETEVAFNGAYVGERDKIDLINKLVREHELKNFHPIKLIEIEIRRQRGFFEYLFEDEPTFADARNQAVQAFHRP